MFALLTLDAAFAWSVKTPEAEAEFHWEQAEIPFYINLNTERVAPDDFVELVTSASKRWSNQTIQFVYEEVTKGRLTQLVENVVNGKILNRIYFEDERSTNMRHRINKRNNAGANQDSETGQLSGIEPNTVMTCSML